MTQRRWLSWFWQLGWVGLLGWLGAYAFTSPTQAQSNIVPDNTLGAESSVVTPNAVGLPRVEITGGAVRGANLFHSFREFNVDAGREAYFNSPNASIQNIFTRVTGTNRSEIKGTLGTIGHAANLFLINPNGIIFGPNAVLNLGGSFVGTTANAVQFGNTGNFSASTPTPPSPLLTINPSALLFNQLSPASITNQSTAAAGLNPVGDEVTGLRVPDGRSLLLVGGNVNLDGGSLRAYEGRIELAGLASPGFVGLNVAGNTLSLNVPDAVPRADVSLSNGAEVNVRGANGGSIAINALDVSLAGESKLRAGIQSGLGKPDSQAGDIEINATGATTLSDGSFISNVVQQEAIGKGGNINITTASLTLRNDAALNIGIFGQGDGGNVFVQASGAVSAVNSSIFSNLGASAVGNSGGIFITAQSLSLTDGDQLQSGIIGANASEPGGRGNAGGVNLKVGSRLTLARANQNGLRSGIFNNIEAGSVGDGGDINIQARSLSLTDGAVLDARTSGQGNGGNIIINARDRVDFEGSDIFSGATTLVQAGAVGKGGDIRVTTGSLSVTGGAELTASSIGQGNAGNITINARDTITFDGTRSVAMTEVGNNGVGNGGDIRVNARALFLKNGGQLNADNLSQGNAGSIIINASDTVAFDGANSNGFGGRVNTLANNGNGGDIQLTTRTLSLTNGGRLFSSAVGNAGNITINARDTINIDGVQSNGDSSGVFSYLPRGTGKGGDIFVTTGSLSLNNGAQINAGTTGFGNGGNITINANTFEALNGGQVVTSTALTGKAGTISLYLKDSLTLAGTNPNITQTPSGIFAKTDFGSTGSGGSIFIDPRQASIRDGAKISVNSDGTGNAGNITLLAGTLTLDNGGEISAQTASSTGGNINLQLGDILLLRRGSQISTNAGTAQKGGDGGNININSKFIVAVPEENSHITANAYSGTGGRIQINTQGLFGIQPSLQPTDNSDITASSTLGVAGVVNINIPDPNALQNSLIQLPDNIIDANALIANSCIARRFNQSSSTFFITGSGALPERPGDATLSPYPTGTIRSFASVGETANSPTSNTSRRSQKNGEPVVEAQGIYRLANGDLVLSRECP